MHDISGGANQLFLKKSTLQRVVPNPRNELLYKSNLTNYTVTELFEYHSKETESREQLSVARVR